jgi:hypothetical protein
VKFCHCSSCRRATSSPIAAFASFADAQVVFSGKVPAVYVSSPGVERGFCGHCGSPLFYRYAGLPGEIHLYPASFVDDREWHPTDHDFYEEHLPWLVCADAPASRT